MSTTTRVGSPMRPGNTAEAITPIIVARTTAPQPIGASGSAARSVSCQETERSTSESAISSKRQHDPAGRGGDQGVADAVQVQARQREHDEPREQDRHNDDAGAHLGPPAASARRGVRRAHGGGVYQSAWASRAPCDPPALALGSEEYCGSADGQVLAVRPIEAKRCMRSPDEGPRTKAFEPAGIDRVANLVATIAPLGLVGLAMWLAWGGALHWPDLVVLAVTYALTGVGVTVGYHRLFTHRSFKTSRADAGAARAARLGGDRGPGDRVGGQPPQAPSLLRSAGGPSQAARRSRRAAGAGRWRVSPTRTSDGSSAASGWRARSATPRICSPTRSCVSSIARFCSGWSWGWHFRSAWALP